MFHKNLSIILKPGDFTDIDAQIQLLIGIRNTPGKCAIGGFFDNSSIAAIFSMNDILTIAMQVKEVSAGFSLQNIVPYFQPIVHIAHNTVWSYEALARMLVFDKQAYLPSEFLVLVKKQKCEGDLTEHMFHLSAQYFRNKPCAWSVNIASQDILSNRTVLFLQNYLRDYPDAQRVILELRTEVAKQHTDAFRRFLLFSKALDIRVCLDQFKGSLSTLDKILDLPIDSMKIDSKWLLTNAVAKNKKTCLEDVLTKAKINEISIIAEHVEDGDALEKLQQLGIEYAQGFYISHPQSLATASHSDALH